MQAAAALADTAAITASVLSTTRRLVEVESPSSEPEATEAASTVLEEIIGERIGITADVHEVEGRRHRSWSIGTPRVLLLGHIDTVWPRGTLERWPMQVADGIATGPGIFDMKAGLAVAVEALAMLGAPEGVTVLVTCDEELGSPTSRTLVEDVARGATACLVLEPGSDGALKTARKGVSQYRVDVTGRAAHAGLEPESGVNALVELSHQVLAVTRFADPAVGTTLTPTLSAAGSAMNVVPPAAWAQLDVRATTIAEQERVDAAMTQLAAVDPEALLEVSGGINRPPMERDRAAGLFDLAQHVARDLALDPLREVAVGGGSDGNFTAAVGTPTLDGLGPRGAGAHAEGEHVAVASLARHVALVAGLLERLLA